MAYEATKIDQITDTAKDELVSQPQDATPILWRVMVRPRQPKRETASGIALAEETVEAQIYNTCVGEVLQVGSMAYAAITKAGLDLSREPHKPKPGDWVLYGRYAGQKMELEDGSILLFLNDTDILAIAKNPNRFKAYV